MGSRHRFDIVVCGGSRQFERLRALLPVLRPHGSVHLASSYLEPEQIRALEPWIDALHEPRHDRDGYENFRLFCIRDINRIVRAPRFVKIDTDVELAEDWFDYVEECVADRPDAVLFGTHEGSNRIDYDISGPLVCSRLGGEVRVRDGLKVNGSFYVGDSAFFRDCDLLMQQLHDLVYAFRDGVRVRPCHLPDDGLEAELLGKELVRLRGVCALRQGRASEDNTRSLAVHVAGAAARMFVRDPGRRIRVPDKVGEPSRWKRAKKWLLARAGVPWQSTKKPEGVPR